METLRILGIAVYVVGFLGTLAAFYWALFQKSSEEEWSSWWKKLLAIIVAAPMYSIGWPFVWIGFAFFCLLEERHDRQIQALRDELKQREMEFWRKHLEHLD